MKFFCLATLSTLQSTFADSNSAGGPFVEVTSLSSSSQVQWKPVSEDAQFLFSAKAVQFLVELENQFGARRLELLEKRQQQARLLAEGGTLDFLPETKFMRDSEWSVAKAPSDLNDRRVEITGPAEKKMMINALNSGAKVFMADLEDALSPTWENSTEGQVALYQAVRRQLKFTSAEGKNYQLNPEIATLVVRPRGWHMLESHFTVNGNAMSGSLFDFGLYFFHNAAETLKQGSGPYFYLPKMESHLEARLWNDVFIFAQKYLGIPVGTIRATVLIETIPAAFQMEEILFELKEHAAALNAGRWDYLFSIIKKFVTKKDLMFPDRAQLTMAVPFMQAYCELLVSTCHKRGAHAMGGMAAFIPSRRDAAVNESALIKVNEDKQREARLGFDGTWVAHPDLVLVAMKVFDQYLGTQAHQKQKGIRTETFDGQRLLPTNLPDGKITEAGFRNNVSVALQYIEAWLRGQGAVAIFNLMEDAATAEISRAELWQWVQRSAKLDNGTSITKDYFQTILNEELAKLGSLSQGRYASAVKLLQELVLAPQFTEFLTTPAYQLLETP